MNPAGASRYLKLNEVLQTAIERRKQVRDITGGFFKIGVAASDSTGGEGTDTKFNPNIYDILLPVSDDQVKILGDYNVTAVKLASVPMMGRSRSRGLRGTRD